MTAGVLVLGLNSARVVYPAPCPPWCIGSVDCGAHREERYHAAREVFVKLGPPDVTAHVVASRDDDGIVTGKPYVYLSGDGPVGTGHDWAESLTPAAALQLGQALIAAAAEAGDFAAAGVAS